MDECIGDEKTMDGTELHEKETVAFTLSHAVFSHHYHLRNMVSADTEVKVPDNDELVGHGYGRDGVLHVLV